MELSQTANLNLKERLIMRKTLFVSQLSKEDQGKIEALLIAEGLNREDIETAMDSRLCDLSDTINLKELF